MARRRPWWEPLAGVILLAMMANKTSKQGSHDGWVWPMPRLAGMAPQISQEFRRGAPEHLGVDVMYRSGVDGAGARWVVPEGAPVLAAGPGVVERVERTARGTGIVIRHAPGLWTYYQHLATAAVAVGESVAAGEAIGTAGADPTDPQGLRHLHFALWEGKWGNAGAMDPADRMRSWAVVDHV